MSDRGHRELVDRRRFLQALGTGAATVGLVACADDGPDRAGGARASTGAGEEGTDAAAPAPAPALAGAVLQGDAVRSFLPTLTRLTNTEPDDVVRVASVPAVPPAVDRAEQRVVEFSLELVESVCPIDPASGVTVTAWGFRIAGDAVSCGTPGPVLRARVGDLVRVTLSNPSESANTHTVDFHALTGPGGGSAGLTVAPGKTATVNGRLLCPGVFLYHCASGDVPMHVAHGMSGMFIVDPEEPLPAVDHEWAIVRTEWYVNQPDGDGFAAFDAAALLLEHPRYVTFNGRTDALTGENALEMEVGHRARLFVVNGGLSLGASIHPVGSHWDCVYPEGATHPLNPVIRGSQTTSVLAGGGVVAELVGHVPSTVDIVDHALARTYAKGCIASIVVNGDDNAIFSVGDEGFAAAVEAGEEAQTSAATAPDSEYQIVISPDAWDPANAEVAYSPATITVPAGTIVAWQNTDTMAHTVTSGTSTGQAGTPDGRFDSGVLDPGGVFEHTFDEPGTYDYFCQPHPWMIGQVVVTG